jgi:hypothetical protein
MNNLQKISLERAISYLKSGKLQYAIIDEDGNKYGDLEVINKTGRKRGALKYPMGTVRNYYLPYVENLQKDDGVSIPCGDFSLEDLQSNLCAWACHVWGSGNYSTVSDKENKSLIIFRLN